MRSDGRETKGIGTLNEGCVSQPAIYGAVQRAHLERNARQNGKSVSLLTLCASSSLSHSEVQNVSVRYPVINEEQVFSKELRSVDDLVAAAVPQAMLESRWQLQLILKLHAQMSPS